MADFQAPTPATVARRDHTHDEFKKNNLSAIAAPTVNDDHTAFYSVGSRWIDVTNGKEYVLLDASVGAAVWQSTSLDLTLDWGLYTPTLTNVTNIAASTAYQCQYMRVGDIVTVSGRADIDPTSTGDCTLRISLPIASQFTAANACAGAASANALQQSAAIAADDVTLTNAKMIWNATDAANRSWFFTFTYYVLTPGGLASGSPMGLTLVITYN